MVKECDSCDSKDTCLPYILFGDCKLSKEEFVKAMISGVVSVEQVKRGLSSK